MPEAAEAFRETTRPLLRPRDVEDKKQQIKSIESTLNAPAHVQSQIQNKGAMIKRLGWLKKEIDTQAPRPYAKGPELDNAKKRHDDLLEEIKQGMPTQEEMRRRPAGAVDKHRAWTQRNKDKVLEWKNIRLCLHASGDLPESNIDAADIANLERFRPTGGAQELNMHGELIEGKQFHQRPPGAGPVVVLSDGMRDFLAEHDPDLLSRMAALSNDDRATVIDRVRDIMADHLVSKLKTDPFAKARAAKAEKKAAKETAEA